MRTKDGSKLCNRLGDLGGDGGGGGDIVNFLANKVWTEITWSLHEDFYNISMSRDAITLMYMIFNIWTLEGVEKIKKLVTLNLDTAAMISYPTLCKEIQFQEA